LHIAIVDDEKIICDQIKVMIQKEHKGEQIEQYSSGQALLTAKKQFDLVFLDIQMDGIDGMKVARELRRTHADTILIFVTGVKDYVFEAFDVSAFHYLLKPLDEEKFAEVLNLALEEAARRKSQRQEQLFIRAKNLTVNQMDILYMESRGKKVEIHTLKETISIYGSMSELESQLSPGFYRSHRGYLVNMAYITEYSADSITLMGGAQVYLTKKKHSEFVKAYMWYLQNGGVSCV
jgi:DNA-binding LytR/AlgR family response regulator